MSNEQQPPSGPPREFWLAFNRAAESWMVFTKEPNETVKEHCYHVIERSAYDFWKKRCLDSEDAFKIQAQEHEKVVAERDGLNEYSTKLQDMLSLTQHERDALKAELAKYKNVLEKIRVHVLPGDMDSVDAMVKILADKNRLVKERDQLKAELAGVKAALKHDVDKIEAQYSDEAAKLRSACEMLVGALVKIADEMDADTHIPKRKIALEALAQYEALKRQLAGEK